MSSDVYDLSCCEMKITVAPLGKYAATDDRGRRQGCGLSFTPCGLAGLIRNGTAGLDRPATVTTTLPLVAPTGTGTVMLVADQDVGDAAMPLNVTVLVP